MSNKNTLKGLRVTMKKHPKSLILNGTLKEKLENSPLSEALILYEGKITLFSLFLSNNSNFSL